MKLNLKIAVAGYHDSRTHYNGIIDIATMATTSQSVQCFGKKKTGMMMLRFLTQEIFADWLFQQRLLLPTARYDPAKTTRTVCESVLES